MLPKVRRSPSCSRCIRRWPAPVLRRAPAALSPRRPSPNSSTLSYYPPPAGARRSAPRALLAADMWLRAPPKGGSQESKASWSTQKRKKARLPLPCLQLVGLQILPLQHPRGAPAVDLGRTAARNSPRLRREGRRRGGAHAKDLPKRERSADACRRLPPPGTKGVRPVRVPSPNRGRPQPAAATRASRGLREQNQASCSSSPQRPAWPRSSRRTAT